MRIILFFLLAIFLSCHQKPAIDPVMVAPANSIDTAKSLPVHKQENKISSFNKNGRIETNETSREELLAFAKSLIGIPYLYASSDPEKGFDCSGFITYVFNHFNISVPRSSIDFTWVNEEVPLEKALPGDLVLFTGTDSSDRNVGHMGIMTSPGNDNPTFIHATSGKAWGVTITPLNNYYLGRFVKVIRVFPV